MSTHQSDQPLIYAALRINVEKFPSTGRDIAFSANADQLVKMAELLKVDALDRVEVNARLEKEGAGIRAQGRILASCQQACVITLEPVQQDINLPLSRLFLPASKFEGAPAPGSETFVDLADDDLADSIEEGTIDLEKLIIELLGMEIDLYPRAAGAALENEHDQSYGADETDSPFAALRALKEKSDQS